MKALMARKADEMDVQTVAIATALSISLSAEALAEWRSSRGIKRPKADSDSQNATIGRLAAMFPGAVKVVQ